MHRRPARLLACTALTLSLAGGLAACTGGDGGTPDTESADGGASATASPAPPGRYRTLPEPCGAVSRSTLKKMLPGTETTESDGADGAGEDGSEPGTAPSPYEGEATVTYDTDRRVGCTWKSATTNDTRHLEVRFERVVSFDQEISDDEQAAVVFDERAGAAGIPVTTEDAAPPPSDTTADDASDEPSAPASGSPGAESPDAENPDAEAEDAENTEDAALSPRPLTGLADDAYLDDRLSGADSGGGARRDVTVVFRRANVLVTVEYRQSVADPRGTPDSAALQRLAQGLAGQLAEGLDEDDD